MILASSALILAVAVRAAQPEGSAPPDPSAPTAQDVKPAAEPDHAKIELAVDATYALTLPCNPTTGYGWELKSLDKKIAATVGAIEFSAHPAKPGMVGAGGSCVLTLKGVKPGKTKAVLVYRRSWEKTAPAKTFTARITVVAAK
jgi:inhibitor of cysteine peptidase